MLHPTIQSALASKYRYGIIAGGMLVAGGGAVLLFASSQPSPDSLAPTYDIVLPKERSVEELGGWQRVSPEESDPVFAYNDTIDGVAISVSQQPIPEAFAGNVAASVKQLAESYSATTVIEAGNTQAYLGRSARGPQSVIFTKNNTLVLIKSQKTISQAAWIQYIATLANPDGDGIPSF